MFSGPGQNMHDLLERFHDLVLVIVRGRLVAKQPVLDFVQLSDLRRLVLLLSFEEDGLRFEVFDLSILVPQDGSGPRKQEQSEAGGDNE